MQLIYFVSSSFFENDKVSTHTVVKTTLRDKKKAD